MKYMVVTTNVSNCTIMMARTMHIIHHCIFTNLDHIYTYLYKETEAYWHICKCNKISTMHHKYEYEKNKHIVGIRDDTDTVNWACNYGQYGAHVHPLYIHIHAYARVHAPTCTCPAWRARILHTNSTKCLSCYHIHNILESYSLHRMKL